MKALFNQAATQVVSPELFQVLKQNFLEHSLYLLVANYFIDVEDVTADLVSTESLLASQLPADVVNKLK